MTQGKYKTFISLEGQNYLNDHPCELFAQLHQDGSGLVKDFLHAPGSWNIKAKSLDSYFLWYNCNGIMSALTVKSTAKSNYMDSLLPTICMPYD